MKAKAFLLMMSLASVVHAQPDDWMQRFTNPCGFAPSDSIDLTRDGIPDLVVQGASEGTDDVPNSSGNCRLYVVDLPGTTLLNTRDENGYWRTRVCNAGDTIPAVRTGPQDDLRIPREQYTHGSVQVAYWGYGHQIAGFTIAPDLAAQRYVFRTMSNGKLWHGSFAIDPAVRTDLVTIRVGVLVPADQAFVVQ